MHNIGPGIRFPRETYLMKKGLIKLAMGSKEEMMVSANYGEEMVGPMG